MHRKGKEKDRSPLTKNRSPLISLLRIARTNEPKKISAFLLTYLAQFPQAQQSTKVMALECYARRLRLPHLLSVLDEQLTTQSVSASHVEIADQFGINAMSNYRTEEVMDVIRRGWRPENLLWKYWDENRASFESLIKQITNLEEFIPDLLATAVALRRIDFILYLAKYYPRLMAQAEYYIEDARGWPEVTLQLRDFKSRYLALAQPVTILSVYDQGAMFSLLPLNFYYRVLTMLSKQEKTSLSLTSKLLYANRKIHSESLFWEKYRNNSIYLSLLNVPHGLQREFRAALPNILKLSRTFQYASCGVLTISFMVSMVGLFQASCFSSSSKNCKVEGDELTVSAPSYCVPHIFAINTQSNNVTCETVTNTTDYGNHPPGFASGALGVTLAIIAPLIFIMSAILLWDRTGLYLSRASAAVVNENEINRFLKLFDKIENMIEYMFLYLRELSIRNETSEQINRLYDLLTAIEKMQYTLQSNQSTSLKIRYELGTVDYHLGLVARDIFGRLYNSALSNGHFYPVKKLTLLDAHMLTHSMETTPTIKKPSQIVQSAQQFWKSVTQSAARGIKVIEETSRPITHERERLLSAINHDESVRMEEGIKMRGYGTM